MDDDLTHGIGDAELGDLARLVDGTLPAGRRVEVEAHVAASPQLGRIVERQSAAVAAVRATADTGAPLRLRAHVDRRRAGTAARPRRRVLAGTAVAVAASALVALALVISAGSPSVTDAVELAQKA